MSEVCLLTGATGFVGLQILKALERQGVTCRVVARKGKEEFFDLFSNIESVIITDDLFAEPSSFMEAACGNVHTVIHAAWYVDPEDYLQSLRNMDCLRGTLLLSHACAAVGVKRFVGLGTCFEYDVRSGYLSTETAIKPTSMYAASKAAAFLFLLQFFQLGRIEFAWARLFYLFGEGEKEQRLVPYIRSRLERSERVELTSGDQVRDFLDVKEAGRKIAELAMGSFCGPANICSGTGITVRALAEKIADEYGRRDLLAFGARPHNLVDPPCVVGII
jgi:dTDP-6-deoxy-L-talose 4-dehydrogenase (NAD+)